MSQKILFKTTTQKKGIFKHRFTFKYDSKLFSPKILLQLFVYSMTFSILLVGLKSYSKIQSSAKPLQDANNTTNVQEYVSENNITPSQINTTKVTDTQTQNDASGTNSSQFQEDIAKNVVRLHVIANSDTDADQSLKLAVRDEIITSLQKSLKNADSVAQAKEIIARQQFQIQKDAQKVITAHNCNYSVNVSLKQRYFPVKQYGDLTFPAGTYEALCVEIGTAKGHNWWCVLFPSLCFVNETTAIVPDESKEKLKENLSEDAYDSLYDDSTDTAGQSSDDTSNTNKNANSTDNIDANPAPENEKPEVRSGILDWFSGANK